MAGSKKKAKKRRGFTLPVAALAGVGVAVGHVIGAVKSSGLEKALRVQVPKSFLGYNPENGEWGAGYWSQGLGPMVLGFATHFLASKLGVNRMLGQARVPIIRV